MFNEKRICKRSTLTMLLTFGSAAYAFAADTVNFGSVVAPIVDLLNSFIQPLVTIVGAVGALYCILLGVKYARAEEPQDREKAKAHLKGAIIGFVLIFVLIEALNLMLPILNQWASKYYTTTLTVPSTPAAK